MIHEIAKVNGKVITERHLDDMVLLYKQQTNTNTINESEKKKIVEQIIDNFLLLGEAEKRNIVVESEIIEKNIAEIKKQFEADDNFYDELKKHGISYDVFKKNIRDTLLIQKFANDESQKNVKITADMLETYYKMHKKTMISPEMVRARHILVGKSQAGSMEKAKEKADKLLEKLKNGANFENTAKEHSDCPSAAKGGDLGMFRRGQMVPEFEKSAFSLKVNEISNPVSTGFGVHLIRVDEKIQGKSVPFKDAQPYIEKIIFQQESQKVMKALADELKKTAEIEVY